MPKANKGAATYVERKKASMYAQHEIWQNRVARLLVIIVLCVHPLYFNVLGKIFVGTAGYMRLTWDKFLFFVIYMIIILLIVFVVWISRISRNPKLLPQDRLYLVDWAILGFVAVTLISAIFSPFRGEAHVWVGISERYDGAITQLLYVTIFLIVSRWYKPRERDFIVLGISAVLVALIGIIQFYGLDIFGLWPYDDKEYGSAMGYTPYNIFFRSTLGNVNIVSAYVCVAMLLCGFLFIKTKSKWRPLWLAASALNFWLMELADADSGRVGLLVTMVLAIPFIIENRKTLGKAMILASSWAAIYGLQKLLYDVRILQTKTAGSLLIYAALFIVLLAAGLLFVRWGTAKDTDGNIKWKLGIILIAAVIAAGIIGVEVLGRQDPATGSTNIIYELREIIHGNIRDEFATNRIYIWRNALKAYPNNPIIGSGPDTFLYAFPEEAQMFYDEKYQNAHNEYVQILICQGIIGLVCYLVFIVGLMIKSIPKAFKNPMLMAVLAAFAGYCIQAFFNLSIPIVTPMLWVFAGMLANTQVREETQMLQ